MAQVLKFIRIVLRNTIKYWGMPLLGALLMLGFGWVSYGTLVWLEALVIFLLVFMVNNTLRWQRKRSARKYSHVVN